MEKNDKRKGASKWLLTAFFLLLMLFDWWLSIKMANDPFIVFVIMVFLTNGLAGLFFARIYNTIKRKDDKKDEE